MTEKNNTDHFITVAIFTYAHELTIIRSRLEAEGIECKTIDELTVQVNPLYSPAIGGVKLQVKESDAKEAIEILKEGGYVTDLDFQKQESKTITFLDKYTSKIPFLSNVRIEIRLMIIIAISIGLIASLFHFATLPSNTERLLESNWCIENIAYKGKEYSPKTLSFITISGSGYCAEKISFDEIGRITLPGFNSHLIDGQYEVYADFIKITKTDTFDFVYDGEYKINFSDGYLFLTSKTTSITCRPERSFY